MKPYTLTDFRYGDPLQTAEYWKGKPTPTPWQVRPSRTSWVDFEVRRYADGTEVRWERECGRWESEGKTGDWEPAGEREARKLRAELDRLRTDVFLYLHADDPEIKPPLRLASRPSLDRGVWRERLEIAASKAPREAIS